MPVKSAEELESFLESWSTDPNQTKGCFLRFKNHLENFGNVNLAFVARPGITYSLRAAHANHHENDLFAMVDVIDDDPAERWLSVCFYDEFVDDPDQLGDEVPGGLMGKDARCFDLYNFDDSLLAYIEARLSTAYNTIDKGR